MSSREKTMPGEGIPQTIYALARALERRILPLFQDTHLHWGLRRILQHLWLEDGLSQAELAAAVQSSEASISNMLKHLLKGEWVERRRDPYDYRISRVYLTDKGKAFRTRVEAELAEAHEAIQAQLPDGDTDQLAHLLESALDALSAEQPEDDESPAGIYDSPAPPGSL